MHTTTTLTSVIHCLLFQELVPGTMRRAHKNIIFASVLQKSYLFYYHQQDVQFGKVFLLNFEAVK